MFVLTIIDKTCQNTLLAINAISIYNRCIICSKGGFGMKEKTYYNEIKTLIEAYEVNHKVRALQDNSEKLLMNWNIGRLLVEAQGGMNRAKYGDGLIKEWSLKLSLLFGKNYSYTNLKYMRQFYLSFPNGHAVSDQLTWTHYRYLLSIKNEFERNYYINQVILNHLSVRELRELIKSKAYDRLSYVDKENIKLISDNTSLAIKDMIKDPILIKTNKQLNHLDEKILHKYIIEMLENKFLELGVGFALIGHEYKIKENNHTFKIDLLFFNIELNAYVVLELKIREAIPKDIGQLEFYTHLVDKHLKKSNHNKTFGLLIVKKKDKYIVEYTTNKELFITTYKLML